MRSRAKNRNARYADGSLQEPSAVIEVAEASGQLRERPVAELARCESAT